MRMTWGCCPHDVRMACGWYVDVICMMCRWRVDVICHPPVTTALHKAYRLPCWIFFRITGFLHPLHKIIRSAMLDRETEIILYDWINWTRRKFSKYTIEHFAKEFIACIFWFKTAARKMLDNDLIRGKVICIKPLSGIELQSFRILISYWDDRKKS